ncbi:3-methyl-2-oxobutanoate hydroxymethyltransferase [Hoeflea ulvae]|uniref:3-methyl-2-oxobutanoate hydroxymethyltransferase n=1 Tax=Hoeflea ulvae TaxID=2983764 RepID=A0ABT3YGV7_9HYPH|nr:3-methyl-2-oxobutanoate hydroxymethyltransferase [Hoeflea ulvae]MCY0095134.1 3-methyl-2-oxobutanoate hydroxymethyltransferase [Hoeflea ulvae]
MKNIYTFAAQPAQRTVTIACMREAKAAGRKLIQTTANTAEEARAVEAAGIDMMVCDAANAHIVRAANATTFCTAAVKMTEFPTYKDILRESFRLLHLGIDAIITPRSFKVVEKLAREGIPVMGHLGLVPRKSVAIGGLRAVGKTAAESLELYRDYKRLEDAGAFSAESEVIAAPAMAEIAKRTSLICVSLGSGSGGDVSFLFMNDLCGETRSAPRHARAFGALADMHDAVHAARIDALNAFKAASLEGSFPAKFETTGMKPEELDILLNELAKIG